MTNERTLSKASKPPGDVAPIGRAARGDAATASPVESPAARIRRVFRGRWGWTVALALLLGLPLGVIGWRSGSQTYSGRGQVRVAPYADDYGFGNPNDRGSFEFESYDAFIDTQMQFLHTRRVIERAMDTPDWRGLGRTLSDESVRSFAGSMQVSRKGEVLTIEFLDGDPVAAVAGARGIIESYVQLSAEEDSQRGKDKLDFLQAELARSMNRVGELDATVKAKLQGLKGHEGFGIDDLVPLFATKLAQATALEGRLREVQRELAIRGKSNDHATNAAATSEPSGVNPAPTSEPAPADLSVAEIALENGQMAVYINQRREIESTLRRLRSNYYPEHPILRTNEGELKTINDAIREFAEQYNARRAKQGISASDPTSTVALRRLEANLRQGLEDANGELESLARLKHEILEIREQSEQEKLNRDDLRKRIAAQDRLSRMPGRIQVMEVASKPKLPFLDTRPRLAALGSGGGLAAGFAVVLVIGLFERRLRAPEDAGRFGLGDQPVIGMLPQLPDQLSDRKEVSRAAHCVHGIRTSLQLWYGWLDNPVFAVSGAVSGTGKTTLTLALGLSFAAARSRTLLIDFDLVGGGLSRRTEAFRRRPIGQVLRRAGVLQESQLNDALARAASEGSLLGDMLVRLGHVRDLDVVAALEHQRSDAMGVLDVLEGAELKDCVASTEVDNLAILPLGGARAQHVCLVSPLATQRLIDQARAAYDVVLIDTGPATGSLEAASAAAAADGVLVTVSRGDARVALNRCAARLQSVGARMAGVVFNRATPRDFAAQERNGSSSGSATWSARASDGAGIDTVPHDGEEEPIDDSWHGRFGPFGRAVARAARRVPGNGHQQ